MSYQTFVMSYLSIVCAIISVLLSYSVIKAKRQKPPIKQGEVKMVSQADLIRAEIGYRARLRRHTDPDIIWFDGFTPISGSVWQHRNGNMYRVLFLTNNPPREGHPVGVVYESVRAPHTKWSRDLADWHRSFTPVECPTPSIKVSAQGVALLQPGSVWRSKWTDREYVVSLVEHLGGGVLEAHLYSAGTTSHHSRLVVRTPSFFTELIYVRASL